MRGGRRAWQARFAVGVANPGDGTDPATTWDVAFPEAFLSRIKPTRCFVRRYTFASSLSPTVIQGQREPPPRPLRCRAGERAGEGSNLECGRSIEVER